MFQIIVLACVGCVDLTPDENHTFETLEECNRVAELYTLYYDDHILLKCVPAGELM